MTWLKLSGGLWLSTEQLAWVQQTTLYRMPSGGPLMASQTQPGMQSLPGAVAVTADGQRHWLAEADLGVLLAVLQAADGRRGDRPVARTRRPLQMTDEVVVAEDAAPAEQTPVTDETVVAESTTPAKRGKVRDGGAGGAPAGRRRGGG